MTRADSSSDSTLASTTAAAAASTPGILGGIEVEHRGAITLLRLAEPERRNAISLEMRRSLASALVEAERSEECRVVVLTGSGGNFSAGGDLKSMTPDRALAIERLHAIGDVVRLIVHSSKPVVAAVDGFAFGAGLSLAAACDAVVAGRDARFGCAFSGVGLTADAALHWSLPARIGAGRARLMIMSGRPIDAARAEAWGLVDEVVDGPSLDAAVAVAEELAGRAPLSLAATKEILAADAAGLDEVLAREAAAQVNLLATADFAEGQAAFFEKRRPEFRGR
ncbi:MAG TPA: enoyl-CoA hydratase-related protein [Marmoricola sp.]|jgi:enoyl-CoA hydratase/carnithine racemase|nr:enoyl-CoA hydratase-related protein [Marmoricola sp.]